MRNKNPKLSVIIPVYNTEAYLVRCLDSVVRQTYKNLEIIVVNDASPGEVKEIVQTYQEKYPNIFLIEHPKNRGLFQARISGLKRCTGDYFTFVDSDDYISIDLYRVMLNKAEECEADIVAADRLEVLESKGCLYSPHDMLQQVDWDLNGKEIINMLMAQKGLDYGWWVVWNKIYSRQLWENSKGILEQETDHVIMCEDVAFSVSFFSHARHFVNIHHNNYYYVRSEKSSTIAQGIKYSKYLKNVTDIIKSFSIAQNSLKEIGVWEVNKENWQKWLNQILLVWKNRIKEDKTLNESEREKLKSILTLNIKNREEEECNLNQNFCGHGTEWYSIDLYNAIKEEIVSKKCQVVSFDIFDTLILRPFFTPTDLFHMLDCYVNDLIDNIDYLVFTNIRINAEERARARKILDNPGWEDVTLDEIYEEIEELYPHLKPYTFKIKNKEIELEKKFCKIRKSGKELYDCAKASKKKIVFTSDMYLPRDVIETILQENDLREYDKLYLSNEVGLTKSSGELYKYICKKEKTKPENVVHIGDNWHSDIEQARKCGLKAFHLPKTVDMFSNANSGIYSGQYYYKIFHEQKGFLSSHSATEMWGFRCMMAMVANKLYDNPFVIYDHCSDFNADAYTIGYLALGMYTYAIADWLADGVSQDEYKNLNFMARDGYLPYEAFKIINSIYNLNVNCHYLHLSRKAIFPLMISSLTDFYSLYNNFDLSTLSPKKFLKIASPIIYKDKLSEAEDICEKWHISYYGRFRTIESLMKFGEIFFKEFYSKENAREYKVKLKQYLDDQFDGNSATFDVGYNGRCESVLRRTYGYRITANYVHINNDRPFGRMKKSDIKIRTLYPHSPFITGIMREQLMSELTPSCIGYAMNDGKFGPIFENKYSVNLQTWFVTTTMQKAAIDFVKDMVETFGKDIENLPYRFYDACMPLEYYLHFATNPDRDLFAGTLFEDDMGIGNHKSFVDFWNQEIHRFGSENRIVVYQNHQPINYNDYPFLKRWLLILGGNWSEGKKRISQALGHTPVLLHGLKSGYRSMRWIYRKIR